MPCHGGLYDNPQAVSIAVVPPRARTRPAGESTKGVRFFGVGDGNPGSSRMRWRDGNVHALSPKSAFPPANPRSRPLGQRAPGRSGAALGPPSRRALAAGHTGTEL